MSAAAETGGPFAGGSGRSGTRRPLVYSGILLLGLVLFCAGTRWGRTYPTFVQKTWIVWKSGRSMTAEQRRMTLYDSTYPVLLYIRDNTPADAVILLPPQKFIDENTPGDIPLLASDTSVYGVIYPRVPVHWGTPSPYRNRITHVLVWEYWGLDLVAPGAARTEEDRIRLFPRPAGRPLTW